jgi:protein tyrosine phosphatase (PTP) superfamily phosphohydrolase (DUF442 family)
MNSQRSYLAHRADSETTRGVWCSVWLCILLGLADVPVNAATLATLVQSSGIPSARVVNEHLAYSGQLTKSDVETLRALGFTSVINLAIYDFERNGEEDEWVTSEGLLYILLPVDFSEPTENDLVNFFDLLDALEGQKVWVHCFVNYRASAFIYLYRLHRLGHKEAEAEGPLKEFWTPELRKRYPQWADFIEIYRLIDSDQRL